MDASTLEEQYRRKKNSTWMSILLGAVPVYAAYLFSEPFSFNFFMTLGIFWWVGMLIEYWIPPKMPTSFLAWSAKISILILAFILCFTFIPILLSYYMWKPLAYGMPILVFFVCSRWLTPLYPDGEKRTLKESILFGFILAVIYGAYIYFFK